jgi:UDP-N-acetylglucosamine--N-acetylmuramyl-(pentapeptide) pyrophosphoryl-undecaprenol N-acetylglucosamine transferase
LKELRIAIACGGTGGHTYPGLATARVLRERGCDVVVLQAGREVEAQTLSGWDGEVFKTGARQSKLSIPGSLFRTWREFGRKRPDVVVAMGSYTSLPAVVAAWMRGIPVVLHEANAIPGKAIAFLARFARAAGIAFPEAAEHFPPRVKIANVGMPLRSEFEKGTGTSRANPARFSVLVMGGSQGAKRLNEIVVAALKEIKLRHPELAAKLKITHLTGERNKDEVMELYAAAGLTDPAFEIIGFSNEMARLYAESDFCISRAGASSCMELSLAGLPALFVPLPHLAADHQTFNAKSMASRGAGDWLPQDELTPVKLADYLAAVADDAGRRVKMREALLTISRPDATALFADAILATAR